MQLTRAVLQRKDLRGHYRNPNGTYTAAAIRARRPYAAKNAAIGVTLLAFCGVCYVWAYRSFTPDDFSDVPVPPVEGAELEKLRSKYETK